MAMVKLNNTDMKSDIEEISFGDMTLLFRDIEGRKTVAIAPEKGYIIQTVREDCIVLTVQK